MDQDETIRSLRDKVFRLRIALLPFAYMDRENCDLEELACERGIASDKTIITSAHFRRASRVLRETES